MIGSSPRCRRTSILAMDRPATVAGRGNRGIRLVLHRPAVDPAASHGELEISVGIEDARAAVAEGEPDAPPANAPAVVPQPIRELAVLKAVQVTDPISIAIMIPFTYSDGRSKAVLAILHASAGQNDPTVAEALAHCPSGPEGLGRHSRHATVVAGLGSRGLARL